MSDEQRRLFLITQVHMRQENGTLCTECLLPWPCRTWRIAVRRETPQEERHGI